GVVLFALFALFALVSNIGRLGPGGRERSEGGAQRGERRRSGLRRSGLRRRRLLDRARGARHGIEGGAREAIRVELVGLAGLGEAKRRRAERRGALGRSRSGEHRHMGEVVAKALG